MTHTRSPHDDGSDDPANREDQTMDPEPLDIEPSDIEEALPHVDGDHYVAPGEADAPIPPG